MLADVSWECIVDDLPIQPITYTVAENRLRLCEADGLSNDMHEITVNTRVPSQKTFWMDYIQYLPFDDLPLDNATMFIETPDPKMVLGPGWTSYYPGLTTSTSESTFSFDFNGTLYLLKTSHFSFVLQVFRCFGWGSMIVDNSQWMLQPLRTPLTGMLLLPSS